MVSGDVGLICFRFGPSSVFEEGCFRLMPRLMPRLGVSWGRLFGLGIVSFAILIVDGGVYEESKWTLYILGMYVHAARVHL